MNTNENGDGVVIETVVVETPDAIAEANNRATKAEKDRDNYKDVALRRLGKLPGDAAFLSSDLSELPVAEQIKIALLDKEVTDALNAKEQAYKKVVRERDEAILALKNRPQGSIGGESGSSSGNVKDNVFSDAQIDYLRKKAESLKADPEKFIENAKKNLLAHR